MVTETAAAFDELARNRAAEQVAWQYQWSVDTARCIVNAVIEAYQKEHKG